MQKIKQLRFRFGGGNDSIYQSITDLFNKEENVLNGEFGTYLNVTQIGIQGLPGTHFWLNDSWGSSKEETNKGLYLNWTGIFELDLTNVEGGQITSLRFANDDNQILYEQNPSTALIIDILYSNNIDI